MSDETAHTATTRQPIHAYPAAVLEFNLATVPLMVALAEHRRPTVAEVAREVNARALVVDIREAVWDEYDRLAQ